MKCVTVGNTYNYYGKIGNMNVYDLKRTFCNTNTQHQSIYYEQKFSYNNEGKKSKRTVR